MIRRFNRFELKYVVHARVREAMREELLDRMSFDAHGDEAGTYQVTSLYYDSLTAGALWEKLGSKHQRKVRIRHYGDLATGQEPIVAAEIKQRVARTVEKRRVVLGLGAAYALCAGEARGWWTDPNDAVVASEIQFLGRSLELRPSCNVTYRRQAFVGGSDEPSLRITFDEQLAARDPEGGLMRAGSAVPFLPPDWLIMEIKVDHAVPAWVVRVLGRHQVQLRRISKYTSACAALRGTAASWINC
jgi:hypothetical protein